MRLPPEQRPENLEDAIEQIERYLDVIDSLLADQCVAEKTDQLSVPTTPQSHPAPSDEPTKPKMNVNPKKAKVRIFTKDGKIYKASKESKEFGFVKMQLWRGETQIPSGNVEEIREVTALENFIDRAMKIFTAGLIVFVFVLFFWLFSTLLS